MPCLRTAVCLFALLTAGLVGTAGAEGTVRLELVTSSRFPPTEVRRWYEVLTELDVAGLQIRSGRVGDKAEITTAGTKQSPIYLVKGLLTDGGKLVVPGGSFGIRDTAALGTWLDELRKWGPQGAPAGKPAYGLDADQFRALAEDLGQPLTFSTTELGRAAALQKLDAMLKHPLAPDPKLAKAFRDDDLVGVDLQGLSAGTSLAYVLRPLGLAMAPERLPSGDVVLKVAPGTQLDKPWPVGSPPNGRDVQALPVLLEKLEVEIDPTPLPEVLALLKPRLKVPVLIDWNQLAKHQIDYQVKVSHPNKKTWYKALLRTMLFPVGLQAEVRADEANQPFLWITTLKP